MSDTLERVARAIKHYHTVPYEPDEFDSDPTELRRMQARAALAVLQPGDDLGGGRAVYDTTTGVDWTSREKADDLTRQAREDMRERAAQEAETYDWQIWSDPGKALAAAIRDIPTDNEKKDDN